MSDPQLELYRSALEAIRPGAEWTISVSGYESLLWHDETQAKPTEEEFNAAVTTVKNGST
jgi:hypothetical protein